MVHLYTASGRGEAQSGQEFAVGHVTTFPIRTKQACAGWTSRARHAQDGPEPGRGRQEFRRKQRCNTACVASPRPVCSAAACASSPSTRNQHANMRVASRHGPFPVPTATSGRGATPGIATLFSASLPLARPPARPSALPLARRTREEPGVAWPTARRQGAHFRALRAVKNVACPLRDCPREQKPSAQVLMVGTAGVITVDAAELQLRRIHRHTPDAAELVWVCHTPHDRASPLSGVRYRKKKKLCGSFVCLRFRKTWQRINRRSSGCRLTRRCRRTRLLISTTFLARTARRCRVSGESGRRSFARCGLRRPGLRSDAVAHTRRCPHPRRLRSRTRCQYVAGATDGRACGPCERRGPQPAIPAAA